MTDYGTLAKSLISKHFPKFGSFRSLCTYKSMNDGSYDTDSGEATNTPISVQTGLYVIFSQFTQTPTSSSTRKLDDIAILSIDKIAIFPSLDLSLSPEVGDYLEDEEFTRWEVIGIADDPKPAHYELHVRPIDVNI